MVMHVLLLMQRMKLEGSKYAEKEMQSLQFYCKTQFCVEFAEKYQTDIPVEDFQKHFVEDYTNRYNAFSKPYFDIYTKIANFKQPEIKMNEEKKNLKTFFRKNILMFEFPEDHQYVEKTLKYFLAHKNYLSLIEYQDIIRNRVYWGLKRDAFLLEEYQNSAEVEKSKPEAKEKKEEEEQ